MTVTVFDDRPCTLGEGPLWHPERQQFFWCDILENRLLSRRDGQPLGWQFDENVSAAGWTGHDTLLIASETRLFNFNLETHADETVCLLEADNPNTRSNDGRADPQGGFWIGTMPKRGHQDPGAIYRYYRGELRRLYAPVLVPNAMCFTPDGTLAYYTDTRDARIMAQPLDTHGWPKGDAHVFADLRNDKLLPDGSVIDTEGNMWNAQYAAGRVAVYGPGGALKDTLPIPAKYTTCPAFGGRDLTTLYVTTARQDATPKLLEQHPENGMTFGIENAGQGQPEHRVIL